VRALLTISIVLTWSALAKAEMAESYVRFPTDAYNPGLFLLNPGAQRPDKVKAGALLVRQTRTTDLDQSSTQGDKLTSEFKAESVVFGALLDLGAGAGVGLFHENQYQSVVTTTSATRRGEKEEIQRQQHSQVRLAVELTDEIRAGMAVRYLYQDHVIYGDLFLQNGMTTRYKTSLIGYGSGAAYVGKLGGAAYTYFPPLRGKAKIQGEEKIIVESGEVSLEAFLAPGQGLTLGVSGKKWLNELDDRAFGTTASDDQTNISLYGLDVEQFVVPFQLMTLGVDYELNKSATVRVSAAQEKAEFNFIDKARFQRLDVRQQESERHDEMKTTKLRAGIRFGAKGIDGQAGVGVFSRAHNLSQDHKYEASGRELFATIGVQL